MSEPHRASVTSPSKTVALQITYRLCTREDLKGLEWQGLFTHHRQIIRQAFRDQQRGRNIMLLAVANRLPVGQVWIDLKRKAAEGAAFIWAVRVIPWLHGFGIGTDLMRYAEQLAARRGFQAAELGVEKGSTTARKFYERLGYRRIGSMTETFSYTEPAGRRRRRTSREWLMRKPLVSTVTSSLDRLARFC